MAPSQRGPYRCLQFLDRCQHLGMGLLYGRPQGRVGQGLGAAHSLAQGRGYLIQMLHPQILGHALQRVGSPERGLPILGGQGVFQLAKNRIAWLLILMVSSMITGGILAKYEAAFAVIPLLVTFIPMLTDTGGNAGSQSSTMIIRGMAVGEIEPGDLFKVLWKELRVGVIVGMILGFVNYVRLVILYPGREMLCLTVVLSLMATVIIAKTIGCMLPIAAKVFHMDPAIMAAPLITTIVDTLSLMVYFTLATTLLGMTSM